MTSEPQAGEVWWVDLEPSVGSEADKSRPAVVIGSPDFHGIPLRLVVPFTTWQARHRRHPNKTEIVATEANGLVVDSAADGLQLRSVSLERFDYRMGVLDPLALERVMAAIALVTGLPLRESTDLS